MGIVPTMTLTLTTDRINLYSELPEKNPNALDVQSRVYRNVFNESTEQHVFHSQFYPTDLVFF